MEAVSDEDRTTALLGKILRVEMLLILTGVEKVYLNHNRPGQRPIDRATVQDCRKFLEEGQFPAGSMGPEIESAIKFLESGGSGVMIAPLEMAEGVLIGRAGTTVFALPSLLGPTNGSTPPSVSALERTPRPFRKDRTHQHPLYFLRIH